MIRSVVPSFNSTISSAIRFNVRSTARAERTVFCSVVLAGIDANINGSDREEYEVLEGTQNIATETQNAQSSFDGNNARNPAVFTAVQKKTKRVFWPFS